MTFIAAVERYNSYVDAFERLEPGDEIRFCWRSKRTMDARAIVRAWLTAARDILTETGDKLTAPGWERRHGVFQSNLERADRALQAYRAELAKPLLKRPRDQFYFTGDLHYRPSRPPGRSPDVVAA